MVTPSNNNNNNDFIAESMKMALPLQIYLKLYNPDNIYIYIYINYPTLFNYPTF